jgi:hypothetical protein
MKPQKKQQIVIDLINQMFVFAGYDVTYNELNKNEDWYNQYTISSEQNIEWRKWAVDYLVKNKYFTKRIAEIEVDWFDLQWGLLEKK